MKLKIGVALGSARASRAVFRALAKNFECIEQFRTFRQAERMQRLDARRVQPHPRRVCSPSPVFEVQADLRPVRLTAIA